MSALQAPNSMQPPDFEPYVLSPLDHSIGFLHLAPFFTFESQDVDKCVSAIESGLTRCMELLPFLSGNVAPSNRLPGKENVFEVRPATAEFFQQHPMLTIRNHDAYVNPQNGAPTINYDLINNQDFVPISPTMALEELSPVLRLQANVMRDGVIVCFCFHHMAMDGAGMLYLLKSIAACCKDSNTAIDSLPTSPLEQENCRKIILEAASAPSSHSEITHGRGSTVFDLKGNTESELVSRILSLDTKKIKSLQAACAQILKSRAFETEVSISRNAIVTSLLCLCFSRARHLLSAAKGEKGPSEATIVAASEIRQKLGIPPSYFGNGVVAAHASTSACVESIFSTTEASTELAPTHSGSPGPKEMEALSEMAFQMQKSFNGITREFVQDFIKHIVTGKDWSLPPHVADIGVSSLRSFPFYELDFGPTLGPVKVFDIPDNRFPGLAWIMPIRNGRTSDPWEVRLALDRHLMDALEKDRVMRWMSPGNESKL